VHKFYIDIQLDQLIDCQMRDLLEQIDKALEANLYYVALFVSLAIPDICGAIGSPDGKATKPKYVNWFDKYVGPRYSSTIIGRPISFLTGEDCYYFRCSLLHQGSSQHTKSSYSRILFVEPSATTNVFHCNILNDALNIDVRVFCRDIISGALIWLKDCEGTELYQKNYDMFMRRYPKGLSPYMVGVPVIS